MTGTHSILRTTLLSLILCGMAGSATALHWGSFKDNGCVARNVRPYSSVLWDIPWGQSWEDTCVVTPAVVPTRHGKCGFPNPPPA